MDNTLDHKRLSRYEDAILDLIDHRDEFTRSDLQGVVGALVRLIVDEEHGGQGRTTTWIIQYSRCPTNYNPIEKAVVEAETAEAALALLKHALHEDVGSTRYVFGKPEERPATPPGRIVSMTVHEPHMNPNIQRRP